MRYEILRLKTLLQPIAIPIFKGREMPSVIWGKPDTPIENISFKNVSITAKGGHPVEDAEENRWKTTNGFLVMQESFLLIPGISAM